jgi:hypothetical protein
MFLKTPGRFQNDWKSHIASARIFGQKPDGPASGGAGQASFFPKGTANTALNDPVGSDASGHTKSLGNCVTKNPMNYGDKKDY